MAVANLIPQIWSARLAANMDNALTIAPLANTNYEGEISGVGSVLKIQKAANLTIGTYAGTVTFEAPTSTTVSLTVDQDRYFAFTVDDLERVQANVDLVDSFTRRAGYGLADALDGYLAGLYTAQAAGDVAVILASGDMYTAAVKAGRNLDLKSVPREGRWLVVTPAGYANLLANTKFTQASAMGDSVIATSRA
ncbi:MAG: hypothetical protein O3A02_03880 [bacterium]|nr:hypothetical protein [bacterium]